MKKLILILLSATHLSISAAQNPEAAFTLVEQGVALHDKSDFNGAIALYDKAMKEDKDNLQAMAEKGLSLLSLEKYDDAINICLKAIKIHPNEQLLNTVYVTCGNAYDMLKQSDKAIDIFNQGLKVFPNYYQLHYNKGITYSGEAKIDESLVSFQDAVMTNPAHASSHNAIARISNFEKKQIPEILATCRFFMLEPKGERAEANLTSLIKTMKGNVEQKNGKNININIDADMLIDTTKDGSKKSDNFMSSQLMLSLLSASDFDKKYNKENETERFIRKFSGLCTSLEEGLKQSKKGFYWEYYAPYFVEMNNKKLIEPFAYVVFASSKDPKVAKWLETHDKELDQLFAWSKTFSWKSMR